MAQQVKDVVIAAAHVAALARELPYDMGATKKKKKKSQKKKKMKYTKRIIKDINYIEIQL